MLDSKGTFDDLVQRYARTPEQAEAILGNRLYQNLAGALSGTQEYMAMEKLYELVNSGEFDIVVVDTPPTRNALDLLDAPRRLTRFLENRLFRALLVPTRMSLRAVGVATQALLRTISKVAGAEIVQDAVGFFQAFEGMEDGFRSRASAVHDLLADPATAYVLVTSARPDAVTEAGFFAEKLAEREVAVAALVVNRIAPSFGNGRRSRGRRRAHRNSVRWRPTWRRSTRWRPGRSRRSPGWRRRSRRPRSAGSHSSDRTCTSCSGCSGQPTNSSPEPPSAGGRDADGFSAAAAGPIVSPRCRPSWSPATHPRSARTWRRSSAGPTEKCAP